MNKHFLLGAGLALVVTFMASSVFAQFAPPPPNPFGEGLMMCGSLGKVTTGAECDAADAASGIKPVMMAPACVAGQSSTPQAPCTPPPQSGQQQNLQPMQPGIDPRQQQMQSGNFVIDSTTINAAAADRDSIERDLASGRLKAGQGMNACMLLGNGYQMSIKDCLQSLDEIIAGKVPSMLSNQQFNQQQNFQPSQQNQQSLFGQQQFSQEQKEQPNVNLVKPISKISTNLKRKGIALADKLSSTLSKKFKSAKTENKRLAAVKSIAKQLSKVWKYVESAYGEVDEDIFDFDSSVADIADALKSRDPDLAFEITQDVLESIKQILEQ